MLVEILQYRGGIIVLSQQYSHLFQRQTSLVQGAYLFEHILIHPLLQFLAGQHRMTVLFSTLDAQCDAPEALGVLGLAWRGLLLHVGIYAVLSAYAEPCIRGNAVQQKCCLWEEAVVEVYYTMFATVVRVQRFCPRVPRVHALCQSAQQAPLSATPAIYALLYVAHYQIRASQCLVLEQKHTEVVPLQTARILELVYHYVPQHGTYLLEHEGVVLSVYQSREQGRGARQGECLPLLVYVPHYLVYAREQLQLVGIVPCQFGGIELACQFLLLAQELLEPVAQGIHQRARPSIVLVLLQQQSATVLQKLLEDFPLCHVLGILVIQQSLQICGRCRRLLAHHFRLACAQHVP